MNIGAFGIGAELLSPPGIGVTLGSGGIWKYFVVGSGAGVVKGIVGRIGFDIGSGTGAGTGTGTGGGGAIGSPPTGCTKLAWRMPSSLRTIGKSRPAG